jgi:hypothetical protein
MNEVNLPVWIDYHGVFEVLPTDQIYFLDLILHQIRMHHWKTVEHNFL